ncbi:MAG: UDP-N-acetylmuramoyl-L-alanine--D-glutamate ligase [Alphaproteobacteria bacterium CG11_big_fil_rev_8_21_14_0_20_44_7]|nr:MAG: UDP-N-acetylmuramoyl-L-alanine--D-glutamate ligase [Alphaproteobacteria bacterium CG11_big_fil_rev_8_21_14_0_20_44_7]
MTKNIIAIFGLGKSGKASYEYLKSKGYEIVAWDDTESSHENIPCTAPQSWDWGRIEKLVLAPGIPLTHPKPHYIVEAAHKANVPIICDIEILYLDNMDAKFIGITGTNGKSTTTALIGHILEQNGFDVAVGGNIGNAALSLGKHKYYVLEMSSYQLDLIDKTRFNIAVWMNITPDHIDRHGDIQGYIKAKKNLFRNGNDIAFIGRDDEYSKKLDGVGFSKKDNLGDFPNLPGEHNMQNINAAFKVAKYLGISENKIIASILSFPGLAHRIEFVSERGGVKFINDSKATNADSAACALSCFEDIHWILGGVAKAGGIKALAEYFPKIRHAYLIGEAQEEFAGELEGKVTYSKFKNLEDAVKQAASNAEKGVVLLSPACASFDQFKNFEERGDVFKKIVLNL